MQVLISDYRRRIRELGDVYERRAFKKMESGHRIIGIVGPRGAGKTTYMLNYLKKNYENDSQALYVSADDLYFSSNRLIDLVEEFINNYDGKLLCIDEIHKYPEWAQELKNIYDKYRFFKIIFSGSSGIDLMKEKYDLSRRAVLRHLPGLSFREFLEMKTGEKYPVLKMEDVIKHRINVPQKIIKTPKLQGFFNDYLKTGYYPMFAMYKKKNDFYEALAGILEKTVYMDIASYYSLKTPTLPIFKNILYFIFTSAPSEVNVNRVAKSLGKDYNDVAGYFEMMKDSGLLRFLLSDKSGHALIRKPEKAYLNNPNLYYALESETGKTPKKGSIREVFTIASLENAGLNPFYSQKGDIKTGKYVFEVGGKNKDQSQIKDVKNSYLAIDGISTGDNKKIPLYLFGFLY
jgi:hypothetical protein